MADKQITRSNMFEPLLTADPTFGRQWHAFTTEYAHERDLPLYIALGLLAHHLIDRSASGDTSGFKGVFTVVEEWLVYGDEYVREAAAIGLFESLQNMLGGQDRQYRSPKGVRAADFDPWLLPESKTWWEKLYRFWEGDLSALRDGS
jgi:hypothetical protein